MKTVKAKAIKERGAAMVEFALVLPLLVTMVMFSLYFTELIRAKIRLQEAARYASWEMTSYALTDFGEWKHDEAFDKAKDLTVKEATTRYADLDSVEDTGPQGFVVGYQNVAFVMENKTVPFLDGKLNVNGGGGGLIGNVLGKIGGGANWVIKEWGFNPKGKVQTDVTMDLSNKLLPKRFLQRSEGGFFKQDAMGGVDLSLLKLKAHHSLVASGWHLPDGGDADLRDTRAGWHRDVDEKHGLYNQVDKMDFLGLKGAINGIPGLGLLTSLINGLGVGFLGTYVVSHNYFPKGNPNAEKVVCPKGNPGSGGSSHPAPSGLNNLNDVSKIDVDILSCYETAPFRDRPKFTDAPYLQTFMARGEFFMGCQNEQADDPTSSAPPNSGDKSADKTQCNN